MTGQQGCTTWFINHELILRYGQQFKDRRLIMEWPIDLDYIDKFSALRYIFSNPGRRTLYSSPSDASGILIQEFYANVTCGIGFISSWVPGIDIMITTNMIRRVTRFIEVADPTLDLTPEEDLTQVASFMTRTL